MADSGMSMVKVLHEHNLLFKDLFIHYVHSIQPPCMPAGQKKAPDLITGGCEPPCGCWQLNSGPPKEQSVLLTTESSVQPQA